MSGLHRREFVRGLTAASLCSALQAAPLRRSNLGVQLYTFRDVLPNDPGKTLRALRDIGYAELEVIDGPLYDSVMKAVPGGLKPVSVHMQTKQIHEPMEITKARLSAFRKAGFKYVVYPYVDKADRGGLDSYKKLSDTLNTIGGNAREMGMQLCYHNHAFDFEPMGGSTPLDAILSAASPENLALEMDIFWVAVAGKNPRETIKKFAPRIKLLHVKDLAKEDANAPRFNEDVPKSAFKEAGKGALDIPSILAAADGAGVEHYFVEQDQSPDPLASVRTSYEFLSKVMA